MRKIVSICYDKLLVMLILIHSFISTCSSQARKSGYYIPRPMKYSSCSIGMGTTHFLGDISSPNFTAVMVTSIRWNFAISYQYTLSKKVEIGLNASYGRLAGDDALSNNDSDFIRNLHFRNDIKQIGLLAQYHPFRYTANCRNRPNISPYLSVGVDYFVHDPQARLPTRLGGEWISLEPLHTEGEGINPIYSAPYKLSGIAIPLGIGLRFKYNRYVDFAIEASYHLTFTDYLDDVSSIYPNTLLLDSPQSVALSNRSKEVIAVNTGLDRTSRVISYLISKGLPTTNPFASTDASFGATGTSRGSKTGNDSYISTSLKIHILFPENKIKCPKLK